ncbi:oligopeptide/dipeptide ABC transporter, ATP-binding protein, C-terminal domain [Gaiella occulta]|uniref:Oligopeptide/dipeptide ABC transporter, ATP-binding protein, C-terminal domain n=1 Tax=Gaiella occulta TaxID=1002870 RepID=A0A7M2Z0E8_9ACTN|nr:ABC transporter ATP-binding protein [Gaiella occulta]RDI75898.1 oligopeptide/dipeptide ABC transporter, ATP-binding protein, C-terminal domain [Gaiella occulta]
MSAPLLEVEGLCVQLPARGGAITVVDGVDYDVAEGEVFGVAGESGSGKTMSVLALIGLLPSGATASGRARFRGLDLLTLRGRAQRDVRGGGIGMVFQDPLTSLHPMLSIGQQIEEPIRQHLGVGRAAARKRAADLLEAVRLPDPERALRAFPHQFSGGMRQRVAIAIALAAEPELLIADEPTTALDVTVQAGIIRLLDALRRERGLSVVLITHDLGVMSAIADRVAVFYAGRVVETGPRDDLLQRPRHPYTRALLDALPQPERSADHPLVPIAGAPPAPAALPTGCAFHPRCAHSVAECEATVPPLVHDGARAYACPVDPFHL